jgi:hypothetical protein
MIMEALEETEEMEEEGEEGMRVGLEEEEEEEGIEMKWMVEEVTRTQLGEYKSRTN